MFACRLVNTGPGWDRIRRSRSCTRSLAGHREGEALGPIVRFVKKACIKKIIHSRAWPTHQMKWKMMFILESWVKFLSVWSNLTLSAYGIEWVLFLNPHPWLFSMFNRNDLFSKPVFSAVFPPTDSRREQVKKKAQKQLGCVLITCLSTPVIRNCRLTHTMTVPLYCCVWSAIFPRCSKEIISLRTPFPSLYLFIF